jgi:alkanesulfonate monooxygenase SsuD/methylene tetrahydromethanopterin reductase-like flavin-dependent oxidoreductase (luciferase family)
MPITSSKESIEFAGRNNIAITPGTPHRGLREDVIGYYARCLAESGHELTPDHIELEADVYLADSKEQAIEEKAPYFLYFNRTLFSHGNATETAIQRGGGYVSASSADYIRPENLAAASGARENYRDLTMDKLVERAQHMAWGTADEVIERLTEEADHAGANTMMIQFNRGALPQELYLKQIRRFAEQVLPALQAHRVEVAPVARRH